MLPVKIPKRNLYNHNVTESEKVKVLSRLLSHVRLFAAHGLQPTRLLCSWDFSRQEYWSGLPFLSPDDLPHPGIKPESPALQADSLPSEPLGKPFIKILW